MKYLIYSGVYVILFVLFMLVDFFQQENIPWKENTFQTLFIGTALLIADHFLTKNLKKEK